MTSRLRSLGGIAATLMAASIPCGASAEEASDPRRDMITALAASGPHPSLGEEAGLFDRLVGTWDCNYSFHAEDGSVRRARGELKFGWILDGSALQDIWISYQGRGRRRLFGALVVQ